MLLSQITDLRVHFLDRGGNRVTSCASHLEVVVAYAESRYGRR
jgi:hypothetical protein